MKINIKNFLILSILILSLFKIGFSVDLQNYQFHSTINVNCSNYLGNVEFNTPIEFKDRMKTYFDGKSLYYKKGLNKVNYFENSNWYPTNIKNLNYFEIQKIVDKNFNSVLILENKSQIKLNFKNPNKELVNKIIINLKNSQIKDLKLYDKNMKRINFILKKKSFTYDLVLNNNNINNNNNSNSNSNLNQKENYNFNTNEFNLVLNFKDYLEIREISFYELKKVKTKSKFTFYLNNQCNKTFNLYFGDYGNQDLNYNNYNYNSYSSNSYYNGNNLNLKKVFKVKVETSKNKLYSNDLDKDGIINKNDNCVFLSNKNQTDINFNGIGDACEDFDNDGILNKKDNCLKVYNPSQSDKDKDGIGDACDKKDNRFFEKNKFLVYILIGVILIIFIGLSILVMKNKEK